MNHPFIHCENTKKRKEYNYQAYNEEWGTDNVGGGMPGKNATLNAKADHDSFQKKNKLLITLAALETSYILKQHHVGIYRFGDLSGIGMLLQPTFYWLIDWLINLMVTKNQKKQKTKSGTEMALKQV